MAVPTALPQIPETCRRKNTKIASKTKVLAEASHHQTAYTLTMLFSNKYFYILSTQNSKRNQIAEKIEENGGVVVRDELAQLNEDGDAASNANYENALKLTHCVILNDVKESTRINNPTIKTRLQQLNTLREFDLHYVTEHWVQDSIRLKQLQPYVCLFFPSKRERFCGPMSLRIAQIY